jgi:predicted MFS family arabinose efflux permease/quinol monooxygenase YgiN
LRYRPFALVWVASLAANMGVWVHQVGAAQAMLAMSPSAELTALIQTATALPMLLFSLVAGAAADLWDRRLVLLAGQALVVVTAIAFAVFDYAGLLTPWLLLGLTALLATGATWRQPAYQAAVGQLVPRDDIPQAIALNSMNFNTARSLGPALGGVLVVALGTAATFAFNAISSLAVVVAFLIWRPVRVADDLPRERLGPAMLGGLRYVRGSPVILAVVTRTLLFGLFASPLWALLPVVTDRVPDGGAHLYGLTLGALGLGAVLGAGAVGALRRRLRNEGVVTLGHLLFALATAALGWFATPALWLPFLLAGGAAWTIVLSSFNVVVQLAAADWVKARALSVYQMATFGGMALGSWVAGALAEQIGTGPALLLASAGLLLAAAMRFVAAMPRAIASDHVEPLPPPPRPETAPGVVLDRGFVAVVVYYEVAPADAAAFERAMRGLRRIRRRDGALRWTLYQDVARPTEWLESFVLGSWVDDLRHMRRATRADRAVLEAVKAYHQGDWPPHTRHLLSHDPNAVDWPPGWAGDRD